jgi:hypothetical protein
LVLAVLSWHQALIPALVALTLLLSARRLLRAPCAAGQHYVEKEADLVAKRLGYGPALGRYLVTQAPLRETAASIKHSSHPTALIRAIYLNA